MASGEDVLWDANDKGAQMVPRLRRIGVTVGCLGFFGLLLWTESNAVWAVYAGAFYLLGEIAYWVWDRRRLVEAHIVTDGVDGASRLRLRRAGGQITEHNPHDVARVLIIRDNVLRDQANLRLSLHGRRLLFGRPGRPPALSAWRHTCPRAHVRDRNAHWGMPGIPD
ncbi:hypothetical protein [Streptomyces sp. NPDC058739]|uniref:hypothetical protein n=1 Tax=Streptomyces sp. NPDC058739 TaxID=3346618 RepID=UPI003693E459